MMNSRWETSDPYYDLRTSASEKLNDQLEKLAGKSVTCIDNDYLAFHRLLMGQSAKHKPRRLNQLVEEQTPIASGNRDPPEGDRNGGETLSLICEGQQPDTRKINDLHDGDGVEMQQKRSQYTEIDRDYAVLVRSLEGENDYHHFMTSDSCEDEDDSLNPLCSNDHQLSQRQCLSDVFGDKQAAHQHVRKMNVHPRGNTIRQSAAVEIEPRKKTSSEVDKGKAIVVLTENVTERRKRKFLETNEGKNLVLVESGRVINEIEHIRRAVNELRRDEKESQVEAVIENYKRNYNAVRQIKKMVVGLENSMKGKFEDFMALQDFEISNQKSMTEDGSTAKEVQCFDLQVVQTNVDGNLNLSKSIYVNGSNVEVVDNVAIEEQRIRNALVPAMNYLTNTENNRVQDIESADAIEFRRCLMSLLTKPFDEKEYANISKRFGRYRLSYPDVAKVLDEYLRKKEKRLNIFRGFFFYLENNSQVGSFEPWKDNECLSI